MKKFFPIFRAGTYPQGTFSDDDLKQIVDSYDPNYLSAPFSTDHKKDGPAFGYAGQLKFENGTIYANSDDMNPALRKAVREKNYGRVSIELFRHLPEKGRYLKAISFLGVKVPAVKGLENQLAQAEFEDQESDQVEFTLDIAENEISFQKGAEGDGTGKSVRDEIQKLRDAGMTLQQIGSQVDRSVSTLQQIIAGDITNPPESLLTALRKVTPPDDESDDSEDPAAGPSDDFQAMQDRIAALEAEKNALADKFQATDAERQQAEERLQEIEINRRKLEFEEWLNARIAFGSVMPRHKEKLMELLLALESVELFEEGEADPVAAFQEFVESLPPVIDGTEKVKKGDGPKENTGSDDLAMEARAYRKKFQEDTGKLISFAEAVHRVQHETSTP